MTHEIDSDELLLILNPFRFIIRSLMNMLIQIPINAPPKTAQEAMMRTTAQNSRACRGSTNHPVWLVEPQHGKIMFLHIMENRISLYINRIDYWF